MSDGIAEWYAMQAKRAAELRKELHVAKVVYEILVSRGQDTTNAYRRVRQLKFELECAENTGD